MKNTVSRLSPVFVLALGLGLSGCSSWGSLNDLLQGEKLDYKSAGKAPPLEIPPDLTSLARDDRYQIPDGGRGKPVTASAYSVAGRESRGTVDGANVLPAVQNATIERAGAQRWLVVNGKAEVLWPIIKEFWQDRGFIVKLEIPEAGVMETDWAENRAKIPQDFIRATIGGLLDNIYSTGERDKFRTRLEVSGDKTEIYISHRGMIEVYSSAQKDSTVWQPRPTDHELEAELLRRLMMRFGVEEQRAGTLVAQPQVSERAKIVRGAVGGALGYVEIDDPFDRAWRRVGLALDRVGFTVEDRDRNKGVYFVRYSDPESEMQQKRGDKGFLGRLLDFNSNKAKPAEKYQIQVKDASGAATQVAVMGEGGGRANEQTANRILGLLHEQLK